MKKTISKLTNRPLRNLGIIVILAFAIAGALFLKQSMAATGLYLTGPASVTKGTEFTVAVKFSTTTPVDGVETYLTYNPTYLQFISIDDSASSMPITLQQSGGNGKVSIVRGKLDGQVSGDMLIANVRFKALTTNKSTNIGLSGNATSAGKYTYPTSSGLTVNLTTAKTGGTKRRK